MTRRVLAIANPISGRGLAQKLAPRIAERAAKAGVDIEVAFTDHAGHGRELAAGARARGFDGVLGFGGDGTLNEIINGIGANGLPLAVVPLGTANVLAKEIRARRDPAHVARALARWKLLQRDLGRLDSGRLFACFVGAGFDGECTRALHGRKGAIRMSQYVPIMLRAVRHGDFKGIRVQCGEAERTAHYALCAISPCYGGPLELASRADPRDGRFEVMTLHEPVNALSLARMLALAFMRATSASKSAQFGGSESVLIEAPAGRAVPIQVDGDFAGELPVRCESLPGALTLIDPA
jgi:diacylglycerol kinase (ATP)